MFLQGETIRHPGHIIRHDPRQGHGVLCRAHICRPFLRQKLGLGHEQRKEIIDHPRHLGPFALRHKGPLGRGRAAQRIADHQGEEVDDIDDPASVAASNEGLSLFHDNDVLSGRGGGTNVHP